eukprot:TRINITY_DN414_c0_g1_i1.p1 TRINITY_DN414_c0_g1~~TRINITY_DN414_c0_g1_i1.p1  ORF type:complete len:241 (-),score=50.65 TRINITY_DN414_c0_g1_i1:91-813(-)
MITRIFLVTMLALVAMSATGAIPIFFDARFMWPSCYEEDPSEQKACVSTWAHNIAGLMTDRYCIKKKNIILSAQSFISCSTVGKCGAAVTEALLTDAFKYAETTGLRDQDCLPYTANNTECPAKCVKNTTVVNYKCSAVKVFSTTETIKTEIMTNGPVVCLVPLTKDFENYYDGIYFPIHSKKIDPIAVKIVGWGIEDGLNYWNVETALGYDHGESGFARISGKFCEKAYSCVPIQSITT